MFNIGDRVRRVQRSTMPDAHELIGDVGTVTDVDSRYVHVKIDKNGQTDQVYLSRFELIKSNNKIMSLIEKAKLAFKSEPEKSFIKVGVMDSNENLTIDGKELLLTYLLEKNKDDFKTTVVDPILAEQEKE